MKATGPARKLPKDFRHTAQAVVIGASAGGVEALLRILPGLPRDNGLPLLVVLHLPEDRDSLLSEVFASRCAMPVREAADKAPMEPGTLYFAPAGYHLLLETDRTFSLNCDAPELYSRPSIDVTLESACDVFGPALVGVVLTGANEDGARGLACVGAAGGLTVVQEPGEAQCREMPEAALAARPPDFILSLDDIRNLITHLELPAWSPPTS
jgi:two-component system, chemotaxis family, protein-glutamate methylesterase/glutaminase